MKPDGSCPTCGAVLAEPVAQLGAPSAPWHFKLLVVALCVYLGWRLVQAIAWIAG
jgi:hypothetical protein